MQENQNSVGTWVATLALVLGLGWALSFGIESIIKKPKTPRLRMAKKRDLEDEEFDEIIRWVIEHAGDENDDLPLPPRPRSDLRSAKQKVERRLVQAHEGVRRLPWSEYHSKARVGLEHSKQFAREKALPWAKSGVTRAGEWADAGQRALEPRLEKAELWMGSKLTQAEKRAAQAGKQAWAKAKKGYQAAADAPYSEYRRAVEDKLDRAEAWVAGRPKALPPASSDFATRDTVWAPPPYPQRDTEIGTPPFSPRRTVVGTPYFESAPSRSSGTWISPGQTMVANKRKRGSKGKRAARSYSGKGGSALSYLDELRKYSRSADMECLDPKRVMSIGQRAAKKAYADGNSQAGKKITSLIRKKGPYFSPSELLYFATSEMPGAWDEAFTAFSTPKCGSDNRFYLTRGKMRSGRRAPRGQKKVFEPRRRRGKRKR